MLFANDKALDTLGLTTFVAESRAFIGAAFVVSVCIISVALISAIASFAWPWLAQSFRIRQHRRRLHDLDPAEKEILAYYIDNQTRSQNLPIQSGIVNALQSEKIIVHGSTLGSVYGFDFIIQPWAWDYLNKHPELLK